MNAEEKDYPKIVLAVIVQKEGKILMNFRKGSFASDKFGLPGGKLDNMETFQQCADRECEEEAGIKIGPVAFVCVMNNHQHAPHHFVTIGLVADWVSGEPEVREPEKCASWGWYELDNLPEPMTEVSHCVIGAYKSGKNYFDVKDL